MPALPGSARRSGLLRRARRYVVMLPLVFLLGCPVQRLYDAGLAQDSAAQHQLARIRDTALPQNYQALIAARFVEALNDPQTRTIAYTATPYGSLVCGTITAQPGSGVSIGPQPFVAYFDGTGALTHLRVYAPHDLLTVKALGDLGGGPSVTNGVSLLQTIQGA